MCWRWNVWVLRISELSRNYGEFSTNHLIKLDSLGREKIKAGGIRPRWIFLDEKRENFLQSLRISRPIFSLAGAMDSRRHAFIIRKHQKTVLSRWCLAWNSLRRAFICSHEWDNMCTMPEGNNSLKIFARSIELLETSERIFVACCNLFLGMQISLLSLFR